MTEGKREKPRTVRVSDFKPRPLGSASGYEIEIEYTSEDRADALDMARELTRTMEIDRIEAKAAIEARTAEDEMRRKDQAAYNDLIRDQFAKDLVEAREKPKFRMNATATSELYPERRVGENTLNMQEASFSPYLTVEAARDGTRTIRDWVAEIQRNLNEGGVPPAVPIDSAIDGIAWSLIRLRGYTGRLKRGEADG